MDESEIDIIKSLKPGEIFEFNPDIYESGHNTIIIDAVMHTESAIHFSYRYLNAGRNSDLVEYIMPWKAVYADSVLDFSIIRVSREDVIESIKNTMLLASISIDELRD